MSIISDDVVMTGQFKVTGYNSKRNYSDIDIFASLLIGGYSKTCVRQPPLKLTLVVDVERWLSYKDTCHVILLAKLHDMYLYKTDNFFHINHYLKSVSKVALLHRFYCTALSCLLDFPNYSRLSLSRLHLSRITAYHEVKIWSLF